VKKIPAILDCVAETRGVHIAGLSLLDRLIVTAHRAGCAPIDLIAETTPSVPRACALGIDMTLASEIPQLDEPALLVNGAVFVETVDLQRVIEERGQLFSADDAPLPVGMTARDAAPVVAGKVAVLVTDATSAREAERRLWASLTSNADGIVDRFLNRPLSRYLSKILVHAAFSPHQVSIVSTLVGILAGCFFAKGYSISGAFSCRFLPSSTAWMAILRVSFIKNRAWADGSTSRATNLCTSLSLPASALAWLGAIPHRLHLHSEPALCSA
jgi:hypothetical protein